MSDAGELLLWHRYLVTIGSATELIDLFVEEITPSLQRVKRSRRVIVGKEIEIVSDWIDVDRISIIEELPLTASQMATIPTPERNAADPNVVDSQ